MLSTNRQARSDLDLKRKEKGRVVVWSRQDILRQVEAWCGLEPVRVIEYFPDHGALGRLCEAHHILWTAHLGGGCMNEPISIW